MTTKPDNMVTDMVRDRLEQVRKLDPEGYPKHLFRALLELPTNEITSILVEEGCEDAHAADREAAEVAGRFARRLGELQPLVDGGPAEEELRRVWKKLFGDAEQLEVVRLKPEDR